MPKGWEEIPCGEGKAIWTVFSASDYDGVGNDAAVCMCGWVGGWMGVEWSFFCWVRTVRVWEIMLLYVFCVCVCPCPCDIMHVYTHTLDTHTLFTSHSRTLGRG